MLFLLLPLSSAAPQPYDERVDARAELGRALECARAGQKPVLVMFGANWCPWCRDLDRVLARDKSLSPLADEVFERVNVSIGNYDHNLDLAAEYGLTNLDDTGIPMLVVLRPDGSLRAVKNSDDFVKGSRYDKSAIRRFLCAYAKRSTP
jgi:protein disulfide-isomerase